MLHDCVVFWVIALVAAVFGFGGIAAGGLGGAQIFFFIVAIMTTVRLARFVASFGVKKN
ncbi:MAG: DUF1328 domain-containing protein [Polaromonas sp.]|nr:MAG: DUF1328 domain-containing protein [Polaromonas sp.]